MNRDPKRQAGQKQEESRSFRPTASTRSSLSGSAFPKPTGQKQSPPLRQSPASRTAPLRGQASAKRQGVPNSPKNPNPPKKGTKSTYSADSRLVRSRTNTEREKAVSSPNRDMNANRVRPKTYKVKKKAPKGLVLFLKRAAVCLVLFLLLFGLTSLFLWLDISSRNSAMPAEIGFLLSESDGENEKIRSRDTSEFYHNGTLYLNMTEIASLYGFTTTGDRKTLRFITDLAKDENILIAIGTSEAVVNGTPIRLSHPSFRNDSGVWLPLDFFTSYLTGLKVGYSEKEETLSVCRIVSEYYARRMKGNRRPNNWSSSKLDAQGVGRI